MLGIGVSASCRVTAIFSISKPLLLLMPVAVRLMKAFLIVKAQPSGNARPGFGNRSVGVQVYVFVLQTSPKPLDEDVVHAPALAVHADPDAVGLQHAGEVGAGELTALVGVKDLRPAEPTQRLFQGIDA